MNILAINGSPKGERSNTWRLTSAFMEGIGTHEKSACAQPPSIEILRTGDLDIKPCLGCFSCWSKTPGACCLHDDMQAIIQKMLWADVIIWSFPLYYFGAPGPLKNLIDRQLPMSLPFMNAEAENGGHPSRYDISGKRAVVISTCGFYTAKGNYDCVTGLFDRLCGQGGYTALFCGQGELFRVKELSERTDEYLSWVRNAGEEFASGASPKIPASSSIKTCSRAMSLRQWQTPAGELANRARKRTPAWCSPGRWRPSTAKKLGLGTILCST